MKKILFIAAMAAFSMTMSAEVLSKDTVAYTGTYELKKETKTNQFGEVNVRYYAVITMNGKERKVNVTKTTYEAGKIDALIYNNNADGSRKLTKAIYRKEN